MRVHQTILITGSVVFLLILSACTNPLTEGTDGASELDLGVSGGAVAGGGSSPTGGAYTGPELVVHLESEADADGIAASIDAQLIEELDIGTRRYVKLQLKDDADAAAVAEDVALRTDVWSAFEEVSWDHFAVPDDALYNGYQYGPQIAGLESAWDDPALFDHDVVIAVIDTGVDTLHEDLGGSSRFVAGWDATQGQAYGVTDDYDANGHGTHVAGIAGAVGDNALGIAGVAWDAKIMPVKALGESGGTSFDVAEAIDFVTDDAIDNSGRRYVINMSLGGLGASPVVADAIARAVENGVVVIAAMGNDGIDIVNYPAAYPGVISVGSTNGRDTVSDYSTRGRHIDLAAPGEDIWSLNAFDTSGYLTMDGTSMASPFVAGVAALLLSKDDTLAPADVKESLVSSATDLGSAGWDKVYGHGRVQTDTALTHSVTGTYGGIRMTVTNSGTPVEGAEVQLRTGDGTEVLHTTITGEGGVAFFPMLPVADSYDLVASYYGETELSDDVAPAATPTEVSAAFDVVFVTVATFWIEYAAGFDDVDTRLTVFDENLAQIAQASDHPNPPDPFFDQPYAHVTFSTAPAAAIYIRVDVEPTPASGFEAPGYATVFANLGMTSTGVNIAVDAGNLPPDPGNDSATATPLSLDSYYPFDLLSGETEYFILDL